MRRGEGLEMVFYCLEDVELVCGEREVGFYGLEN